METATVETMPLWPLLLYFGAVIVVVGGMLALSYILGQHHHDQATVEPYESGVISTGSARLRLSAKFYLVAMLFVIFDLEVAFIITWAIAFRQVGWTGYIGALVFIGILMASLIYEWRLGALDWSSSGEKGQPLSSEKRK